MNERINAISHANEAVCGKSQGKSKIISSSSSTKKRHCKPSIPKEQQFGVASAKIDDETRDKLKCFFESNQCYSSYSKKYKTLFKSIDWMTLITTALTHTLGF